MAPQDIRHLAETCAAQFPAVGRSFVEDSASFAATFAPLLDAVRQSNPRFAFDRDGRPGAVVAIRSALPSIERELLDAVLEDYTCEIAATQEALYQLALAHGRLNGRSG